MILIKDLKGILTILGLSVVLAFSFNALSPHGIAIFGQWEAQKGVVHAISKDDPIDQTLEINQPAVVQQIVEKKQRVVLDARAADFYDMGHIPGALSWPLEKLNNQTRLFMQTFKTDTPILVYCSGITCPASHILAQQLISLGYTDVKVFPGGFEQWVQLGLKVEQG